MHNEKCEEGDESYLVDHSFVETSDWFELMVGWVKPGRYRLGAGENAWTEKF